MTQRYDKATLKEYARAAAEDAGIDPEIVLRLIDAESGFNPAARGADGEIGIAQIIPRWHPNVDPEDPFDSIDYLVNFLKARMEQFGGDTRKAVASWNAGTGTAASGNIPASTEDYVNSILSNQYGTTGYGEPETERPASTTGTTDYGEPETETAIPSRSRSAPPPGTKPKPRAVPIGADQTMEVRPFRSLRPPDMTQAEGQYFFPFGEQDLGGIRQAGSNILAMMGLNTRTGNPWVNFLESLVPSLYAQDAVRSALGGADPDDPTTNPEATIADRIMGYLQSGRTSAFGSGEQPMQQLRDLATQVRQTGGAGLNPGHAALANMLQDPEAAGGTIATLLSPTMSPFLRRYLRPSIAEQLQEFRREAPTLGSLGPTEYLLRYLGG